MKQIDIVEIWSGNVCLGAHGEMTITNPANVDSFGVSVDVDDKCGGAATQ